MPYFDRYIALSTSTDIEETLVDSHNHFVQLIQSLSDEQMNFAYQEDKWTIKDIVQHLIDTERIFVYRALRFARNDKTELPGYDHESFANHTNSEEKHKDQLLKEFVSVHRATILFFTNLTSEALNRMGIASGEKMSVNQIVHIIAGHTHHHLSVMEEKYLPNL